MIYIYALLGLVLSFFLGWFFLFWICAAILAWGLLSLVLVALGGLLQSAFGKPKLKP